MKGVILSRTSMSGQNFCTNVACYRGGWHQYRLLIDGWHPSPSRLGFSEQHVEQLWRPGYGIEFQLSSAAFDARPTHPEDAWIDQGSVRLTGEVTDGSFRRAVTELTHQSLAELFPGLIYDQAHSKGYIYGDRQMPRSTGYLVVARLAMDVSNPAKPAVMCWLNRGQRIQVPVTDILLRRRLTGGEFQHGQEFRGRTVRFSLAHPWDGNGRFPEKRCYLMCSHIVDL